MTDTLNNTTDITDRINESSDKGKNVLVLDSSQISNYLDCPQLWEYQNIERLGYEFETEKSAMNAGTYIHKMLELYYKGKANGLSMDEAAALAFDFDPDQETCVCGCAKETHSVNNENITVCSNQQTCNCGGFEGKPFSLSQDLRYTVRTRFREYVFAYSSNDFTPNNEQSVEVGFAETIFEDSDNLFVLEGRIDLLGTWQGISCVVDHKSQLRKRDLYKKSIQFRNYALVTNSPMLVVNYIRLTAKVDKTTLQRDVASFNSIEHNWWKNELIQIFHKISEERKLPPDQKHKNWGMCGGKYGYPCLYTEICGEPDPEMKTAKKDMLFTIKPEWKPW